MKKLGTNIHGRYTRKQLERLTTLQLRDICYKEKIVKGVANSLDRRAFIEVILRFRGANEDFLIKRYSEKGFTRLGDFIKSKSVEQVVPKAPIQNPARLTIYNGLSIEPRDQYRVLTKEKSVQASNVLLVDEHLSLCGIFYLLPDDNLENEYLLCMGEGMKIEFSNNKKYRLLYFPEEDSQYLFGLYNGDPYLNHKVKYYEVPLHNVDIRQLEESREVLAIDFGTSNTTAGIYLTQENAHHFSQHDLLNNQLKTNEINYVSFHNTASTEREWIELLPTVVGVENCENPDHILFQYGYDVLQHANLTGGNDLSSVFYDIKRWVNSYKETEEVVDHSGNTATTTRGQIVCGFIEYVIRCAQQQFKCKFKHLHISSPVKLKRQFLQMFKELLPKYEIETRDALDEGIAVLYNTIANQIDKQSFMDGVPHKALIIDCGGGTTDLSSCEFMIKDNRLTYQIQVNTTFENGDTNFGGNNLTYRLMQYLKVLMVDYYKHSKRTITYNDVMDVPVNDIYRFVDQEGREALYKTLDEKYQEVEDYLPTKYSLYLNKSQSEYMRVKGNYHQLWRLANEMKQRFFQEVGIIQLNLDKTVLHNQEIRLNATTGFRLSVFKGRELEYIYKVPDISVSLPEISALLKGDIYYIIRKFLEEYYTTDQLQNFSIIKMTGQSCRIDLFRDALKEFIPGRNIEFRQKENHLLDLKLSCLSGALRYLQAKKTGVVRADIQNLTPITPYTIFVNTHQGHRHVLLTSQEKMTQNSGMISKHSSIQELILYLEDANGEIQTSYQYLNHDNEYIPTTYGELNTKYTECIRQDDVDNIEDEEVKFFVYTNESHWGFHVLPIVRNGDLLRKGKEQFFPFENEEWELNFFDGDK